MTDQNLVHEIITAARDVSNSGLVIEDEEVKAWLKKRDRLRAALAKIDASLVAEIHPEEFYQSEGTNLCGLCGNVGVIDTRGRVFSAAGVECGVLRYCLCVNGRTWKKAKANIYELALRIRREP